jgi:hypothetical protein
MTIDWNVLATITSPVIALFAGVWINRRFESRPVLISYFLFQSCVLLSIYTSKWPIITSKYAFCCAKKHWA